MKQGFTFQEHYKLGIELKNIRYKLFESKSKLCEKYRKDNPAINTIRTLIDKMDKLRNILDNMVCNENPDNSYNVKVYYGHEEVKDIEDIRGREP